MNEDEEAGWIEQIHQESTKEVSQSKDESVQDRKLGRDTKKAKVEIGHEDSSTKEAEDNTSA